MAKPDTNQSRCRSIVGPAASVARMAVRANCMAEWILLQKPFVWVLVSGMLRRPISLRVGNVSPTRARLVNQAWYTGISPIPVEKLWYADCDSSVASVFGSILLVSRLLGLSTATNESHA